MSDFDNKQALMQGKAEERVFEKGLEERGKQQKGQDEMVSEQMDKKKQYIKHHIVQEYDGDEEILENFAQYFLQYLSQQKGIKTQEHNLDLLTFQELTDIVANFQQQHPKPSENKPFIVLEPSISELAIGSRQKLEVWNPKKVVYNNGAWDYELNGYQQCTREKTFFCEDYNHKEIVIIFSSNHTQKRGGFFGIGGTLELWIQLKSNVFKETVERTVQDFIFLRKALRKLFPFTFLPPLSITDKDLGKIENQYVRICIMNECRKFINAVCQDKQLFENIYTFRFFKEFKYENYIEHKKRLNDIYIHHVKLLRNPEGCVPIQISDLNQALKRDYSKKSELLEKMWSNVEQSNSRIIQKIKQIKQQIGYQTKQFQLVLKDITNSNQKLHSECYQKLSDVLHCYDDVYKVYNKNLHEYQELFESVNLKLTNQAQNNWKAFISYKSEVNEFSQEYQLRRKVFLEKELSQEQAARYNKSSIPSNEQNIGHPKGNSNAMSVVLQLGLQSDGERQLAWIERYSKWQAYINKQFTLSFEKLVENDRGILTKILQEKTQKVLESNKREEESFIGFLSIIHE